MSRNMLLYIIDIIESINKIRSYIGTLDYNSFLLSPMIQESVIFNLQIIGESVKKIPDEIKSKYADIEWSNISGLRDIIAHAYFNIELKIVWNIYTNYLDRLLAVVTEIKESNQE